MYGQDSLTEKSYKILPLEILIFFVNLEQMSTMYGNYSPCYFSEINSTCIVGIILLILCAFFLYKVMLPVDTMVIRIN